MSPDGFLETGVIYRDENLSRLREFEADSIDLIYLDPPFFSNRYYEVIWGEESEIRSFEDRWKKGRDHYVGWMKARLEQMHRVLKPTGSLYLHCDPHASHYLKVAMDQVFGPDRFLSEIIWKRTGAHSSANRPGPIHDVLLFYSKSGTYTWNSFFVPHDPNSEYVRTHYTKTDPDGRRWMADNLTALGTRKGSSGKPWRGFDVEAKGNHWKFTVERLDQLDAAGRIYWPAKGGWPRYKRYLDEVRGIPLGDVWTDIPPVNARAAERQGYPTQKPEALLKRMIETSSNRGDIVLDPFCGCGTAVAVAHMLGRQWIGIDISPSAIDIIVPRLHKLGADVEVVKGIETVDDLRDLKPLEFQNQIIRRVYGTHNPKRPEFGIDGFSFMEKLPIQVKQQDHVGRPVVDGFETAIQRYGAHKGYIIAFSFTSGAYKEAARIRAEGLEIALIEIESLFEVGRDIAPRPAATQLEADLLNAVRLAALDPSQVAGPPTRSVEELDASAKGVG